LSGSGSVASAPPIPAVRRCWQLSTHCRHRAESSIEDG
jgi:hypothetical protein